MSDFSLGLGGGFPRGRVPHVLMENCMSRKRIPEAVYRGGLQSTREALDTQAGLLSAALSPLFCGFPRIRASASGPCSSQWKVGRRTRLGPSTSVSRSLGQGGSFCHGSQSDMARGPQRARPPPLSHRALSEEQPGGLLHHRGLRQMLSSLLLMVPCSSSSPSKAAAARASHKYLVASWAS